MTKLKIPYNAGEVSHCYDRITELLPVYQKGLTDIRQAMESNNTFEERLRKVLRLHAAILKDAQSEESPHSWNEEDIYLCVLYDKFEAMYAHEATRIALGSGTSEEKRKNLDALAATIARLPFGSPQYSYSIRPRLQKAVSGLGK